MDNYNYGKWQPIETAPKDGTKFLAMWPEIVDGPAEIDVTYRRNDEDFRGWASSNFWAHSDDVAPTHWMPLPKPPEVL